MAKARRKKSPQAIMVEILSAYSDGLLSIVQSHMPKPFAKRLRTWIDGLFQEFELRGTRDGDTSAQQWLVAQLRNPRLPDLRKDKSLVKDKILVGRLNELKEAMAPIFARHRKDAFVRRREAAPIVSKILKRTVTSEDLPPTRYISQFCLEVLDTSAVRLSRASRRLSGKAARSIQRATVFLEAAASDTKNPKDAAKAKRALIILRRDILPGYARRRLL